MELERRLIRTPKHSTGNPWVPAGYTYLGQFIDHDITFDPTSRLDRDNEPTRLVNFRTPRFDLDSLYGHGPLDQPYLYDGDPPRRGMKKLRGVKLLVGSSEMDGAKVDDLPRNAQHRALIGDPRNDENVIVSQLQLLFIHFHNKVIDHLLDTQPGLSREELFDEAQRLVRWHYQWIVVHDFLPKIVGRKMAESVLRPGVRGAAPTVHRKFFDFGDKPFMPVEFSAAAYRFGHSMVRDNYVLNDGTDAVSLFGPAPRRARSLVGRRPLRPDLVIEWEHFFDTKGPPVNSSMRIDPFLAAPLRHVPPTGRALAALNLERGVRLKLPAGRAVAKKMHHEPLTREQLLEPLQEPLHGIDKEIGDALLHATPLWYYVLCEAASSLGLNGLRLGPVGGRIVAEVLVGLLEGDPQSCLHKRPPWKPELPSATDGDFTMPDLVRFAQGDV
jgi:hypothetical protein